MPVTLKDIANELHVTPTTIHKALNGKPGVSDALRATIQEKAEEMGYKPNYMAITLQRKPLNLVFILPENTSVNRFYYPALSQGLQHCMDSLTAVQLNTIEYNYPLSAGESGNILQTVYEEYADHLGDINGIIATIAEEPKAEEYCAKFAAANIPIVLIATDLYENSRLCCVKGNDELTGSLAGELLTLFSRRSEPKKIILAGNYSYHGLRDQYLNALGFMEYLVANHPSATLLHAQGTTELDIAAELERHLTQDSDVFAIYACSARSAIAARNTVEKLGLTGKFPVIGNDLFPESIAALQNNTLCAVIDKQISEQSNLALQILTDFILKNERPAQKLRIVEPKIVLREAVIKHPLHT